MKVNWRKQVTDLLNEGRATANAEAKALLLQVAGRADVEAQLFLIDYILDYEPDNATDALPWLIEAAEAGSGKAAFWLNRTFSANAYAALEPLKKDVPPDPEREQYWLKKAVEFGYFEALWLAAKEAFETRQYKTALALVEKVLGATPKDDDDTEAVAEIKALAEEMKEKLREISKLIKVIANPDQFSPEELYSAGRLLYRAGDDENAAHLMQVAADRGLLAAKKFLSEKN